MDGIETANFFAIAARAAIVGPNSGSASSREGLAAKNTRIEDQRQIRSIDITVSQGDFLCQCGKRCNNRRLAERFVRTIKESCLERMIPFGEGSLRRAIHEFVEHYHRERNHQGLGNRLIMEDELRVASGGPIQRRQRLGGMLNYYYRQAA